MNKEKCVFCGKPMGNSAHTIIGYEWNNKNKKIKSPIHKHCEKEMNKKLNKAIGE